VSLRARRATRLPTRRMTSASVWLLAQVARSHSRICEMLMTGTDMALVYEICVRSKAESMKNILRKDLTRARHF
jgi:hypothetical protein